MNYSYLADGTKVSAMDGEGDGLLYLGSLIYRKTGSNISLESAGFAGGRFVARETSPGVSAMVPMIHVTDHLGSVRAVVDGISGAVVEANDYYPFGSRWNTTASLTDNSNRFRYNSKEEQFNFGTPYIDYGARQYDPVVVRWFAQDPLSEKYYSFSPYAFCHNNPINRIDPDGQVDWKLVKLGALTTAGGIGQTLGGATLAAGTGGIGAAVGMFLLVDGMTSIGVGTSLLITGFITDPSEKNDQLMENIPTNALNTVSKVADIAVGNENHEIEELVEFLEFYYNLATFNPSSIETGVEMIESLSEAVGLYFYMWEILESEQEKNVTEQTSADDQV